MTSTGQLQSRAGRLAFAIPPAAGDEPFPYSAGRVERFVERLELERVALQVHAIAPLEQPALAGPPFVVGNEDEHLHRRWIEYGDRRREIHLVGRRSPR